MFKKGDRVISTHFLHKGEYEIAQYPANLHNHPHFLDEPDKPNPDWAITTDGTPIYTSYLSKLDGKAIPDLENIADDLIGDKDVSPRFRTHLVEFLHEAYGLRASTLQPDLSCFVNAQANTYSYQKQSETNNIAGDVQLCAVRASKGKIREVVPDCKSLNFAESKVLFDSGAFPEVIANCRVTPKESLQRQLKAIASLPKFKETWLVSYDRLIDEKHIGGKRIKQRWTVEEGESAVNETVEAAKYFNSQRHELSGYTLIQSCQGVDAKQYLRCVEQVLQYCDQSDVVGLGGWCILGKQPSYLQTFWETINLVIPVIAAHGITKVHIFGVTWYKPRPNQPLPPLQPMLWLCDQYGIELSTDGRSPIANALWQDTNRAGATFPYWRHNLAWVKAEFATLRDSPLYQAPPGWSKQGMGNKVENDSQNQSLDFRFQNSTPSTKESDISPEIKAQAIFNQFKDEMGGFTSAVELSESQMELVEGIGACYYHIRKDEQVTIRKLAVLPECQKQGWGRLLVYRVICKAIEEKKTSVFLKCPSNSIANQFYEKLGFKLETTEQGKNQPINHWRYRIELPLLFYCGGGGKLDGKSQYDAIALNAGWSLGINSSGKNIPHRHMMMVDNDYKNYKHEQHLEMVKRNKPLIATALDVTSPEQLPEVLMQAEELSKYAGRVLIIPKCDVQIPEKYWLGYSVDSNYGSTPLSPEWFGSRPVHLLGGSPKKQALAYPQMNVISLDANYAQNLATNFCKAVWTDGERNIEKRENGCYEAFSLSAKNLFEFWRKDFSLASETKPVPKESDKWYTPPNIQDLVAQVLGEIDLDPCADDGRHIAAAHHYTATDDGLNQEWQGRVFMNPPYSCPGVWMAKLQAEVKALRVSEAIALVPAATDTNWLSPLLESQPVCFWKGRIKFLDKNYKPQKSPARQSHCLVYWGADSQKFKQVFDDVGVVKNVKNEQKVKVRNHQKYYSDCDWGIVKGSIPKNGKIDVKMGDRFWIAVDVADVETDMQVKILPPNSSIKKDFSGQTGEVLKTMHLVYLPEEDAKVQFDSDEIEVLTTTTEQKGHKTMTTFQFSETARIAEQITQLQKQLEQLTASLKPYQEYEQKAEELRLEVAAHGTLMEGKGISRNGLMNWAKSLYNAASGQELNFLGDTATIAAQNEEIAKLKSELASARHQASDARELQEELRKISLSSVEVAAKLKLCEEQRDQALTKITDMTAASVNVAENLKSVKKELLTQTEVSEVLRRENAILAAKNQKLEALTDNMDAQLAEQQLMPEVEALKQETEGLKSSNKELRAQREQLEKKIEIYAQDTKEIDSYVAQVKQLEKENHTYQEMYEGQKAQKEQWENDFYKIRKERNQLEKQLKQSLQQPITDAKEPAIFNLGDIVQHEEGQVGTVNYIPEPSTGIVSVKMVDGVKNLHIKNLKFVSRGTSWTSAKTQESESPDFQEGDRVCVKAENDELEHLLDRQGTVVGIKGNSVAVLFDATDNEGQCEVITNRDNLVLLSEATPENHAHIKASNFIATIRTKAGANNITWQNISEVCQGDRLILKELLLVATTKIQKGLIQKLPSLMVDYITETGDITDMQWLGDKFKSEVEALLEAKKSLPYHPNDWVRNLETGEVLQIRSFDGEWLSVKQDNKISSLHKSEVELVQQEAA